MYISPNSRNDTLPKEFSLHVEASLIIIHSLGFGRFLYVLLCMDFDLVHVDVCLNNI